jgi:xanthine dehydrogenase accessory factor
MRDIAVDLLAAIHSKRAVAYCRLVETRGSTPQKAGATMLVFAGGTQAGTLGGGCVEAEVKRRALDLLAAGRSEVCKFQLDSDYGWDDGLICGGRMQILVRPLGSQREQQYFRTLCELLLSGKGLTEAIVYDAAASGLPTPANYLFDEAGQTVARLPASDSAAGEAQVRERLRPRATRPRPYLDAGIAYLPVLPRCRLLIVGGGHVGQAVANLATDLDFDVWVVDDRAEVISPERVPRAEKRISGQIDQVLPQIEITPDTYCLIVTRGHTHDEEALFHLAARGARYVGLIGSRRKIKLIFDDLLEQGIAPEALEKVYAPLGIDIGSQTVPEIAVSICAELVAHRNRGDIPGRPKPVKVV